MTRTLKIVFITCSLGYGGAERVIIDLVNRLDRRRFSSVIFCLKEKGALADQVAPDVPVFAFHKKTKFGFLVIWRMTRLLWRERPDIVHTHLFCGDLWGRLSAIVAHCSSVIVSTEHNLRTMERRVEYWSKRILNYWTRRVIFVSEAARNDFTRILPITRQHTQVIPNGISMEKYFVKRPIFQEPRLSLIIVARLAPQKGHQYLIQALHQLHDLDWNARIVGYGPLRSALAEMVSHFKLQNRVAFLGNRQDIPELLSESDIFLLPSVYEGQGIALLEAAASGNFIIASNVDGISEMFVDKETALLVPPENPTALATAIRWVYQHRLSAQSIATRGQMMVARTYRIETMVQSYEKMYENTANQ